MKFNNLSRILLTISIFVILISMSVVITAPAETTNQEPVRTVRAIDVGIDGVGDVTAITNPEHFPGQPITLNCTVREYLNTSVSQPFTVLFTIDDNVPDIPGYHYQDNQTVQPWMLPPGQTINLTWNWTPPLHAPPGSSWNFSDGDHKFTAIFTTIYDGDSNSANNQKMLDVIVKKPDFQVEIQSGWNNLPEPIKTITITPGTVTKFPLNFTVFNFKKETWIDFNITTPAGWQASTPPPKFFSPNSNSSRDNLSLIVFPSIDREYSPTQTELPIILKGTCRRYPFATDLLIFKVKISFIPFPEIIPPDTKTAQPGEVYVDFNVINDGNGQDSFISEATVGQTTFEKIKLAEQGWKAIVHSGKYSRIMARGETHNVRVKVTIPSTVPAGAPCLINLTVTSEKAEFACPNHDYAIQSGYFYIYSGKMKNVDVQDKIAPIDMAPDSEKTISFTVRNVGNGVDKTITCNITDEPEAWKTTLDTSDIPFTGLGRQAEADIELTIRTPKEVTKGTYTIKVAGISEGEIKDESTITINILQERKVDLICKESRKSGNVSERLEYVITVRNVGNSPDTIDLTRTFVTENMQSDWTAQLSKKVVTLYPYQSSDVILTVEIPIDALADTNPTTHAITEPYEIELKGVSQNDTSIKDTVLLEVNVEPIYNFKFSKESDTLEIISGKKTIIDYEIEIQNLGNTWDTIDFTYEGESWEGGPLIETWTSIPFHKRLPPGQIENVFFGVEPPADIPIGEYTFTITGTSANDKSVENQIELTIRVITSDLEISAIRFNGKTISELGTVNPNDVLLITVDIQNVGDLIFINSSYGKIFIEFHEEKNYIGDRNLTYLPTESYDAENSLATVSISWTVGKSESYTIIVRLDPDGNFPESDTSNNVKSETILVEGGESTGTSTSDEGSENEELMLIVLLIIILIVILFIGLWITLTSLKKAKLAGYTEDGEYKPYEDREEITFDKDEDHEGGDEFEVPSEHPYGKGGMKGGGAKIITTKPIRKTKPIKKIKPLKPVEELPEPINAPEGYLPPADQDY
jgi:uncharacterized membrane protein